MSSRTSRHYGVTKALAAGLVGIVVLLHGAAIAKPDNDDERKHLIVLTKPRTESGLVSLVDGEVMVQWAWPESRRPRRRQVESECKIFELVNKDNFTLIKARPKTFNVNGQTAKTLDFEGWYLTGDYSTNPPSVKVTETIEEGSYWRIPKAGSGPLVNLKDPKRPTFVVPAQTRVLFDGKGIRADVEYRPLQLSYFEKAAAEFLFEKWERGAK